MNSSPCLIEGKTIFLGKNSLAFTLILAQLKDPEFKFLATAPSTLILAKPEGGGVQCKT
jgi:hypothetical protein